MSKLGILNHMALMDPYKLLGIDKNADEATIKKAYRHLAKTTHPDAGGNAELFRITEKAYWHLTGRQQSEFMEPNEDEEVTYEEVANDSSWFENPLFKVASSNYAPVTQELSLLERIRINVLIPIVAIFGIAAILGYGSFILGIVVIFLLVWFMADRQIKNFFGGRKPPLFKLFFKDEYQTDYSNATEWFDNNKVINLQNDSWFDQKLAEAASSTSDCHVFCNAAVPEARTIRPYIILKDNKLYIVSLDPESMKEIAKEMKQANKILRVKGNIVIITRDSSLAGNKNYYTPEEFLSLMNSSLQNTNQTNTLIALSEWCE